MFYVLRGGGSASRAGGCGKWNGIGAKAFNTRCRPASRIPGRIESLKVGFTMRVDLQPTAITHVAHIYGYPFDPSFYLPLFDVTCLLKCPVHDGESVLEIGQRIFIKAGKVIINGAATEHDFASHCDGQPIHCRVISVFGIVLMHVCVAVRIDESGSGALQHIHAGGVKISTRKVVAAKLIVGQLGTCLQTHDVGITGDHFLVGIVGLKGLGACGQDDGLGLIKLMLTGTQIKTQGSRNGFGIFFSVHQVGDHGFILDGYTKFAKDLSEGIHELGTVKHHGFNRSRVRGALAFQPVVGAVFAL